MTDQAITMKLFDTNETAVFYGGQKDEPTHRVWLRRSLKHGEGFRPFVMILHNPSIAGKENNDPTARRGISFAIASDATDLIFVNAATRIATDANDLTADDLNCPWSNFALQQAADLALANDGYLVAAWGSPKGNAAVKRAMDQRFMQIRDMDLPLSILRLTPRGYPEHPLYLPGTLRPVPWRK